MPSLECNGKVLAPLDEEGSSRTLVQHAVIVVCVSLAS